MRPTIDERLQGIRRLLDQIEATASLPEQAVDALTSARRLLALVARSWSALLPFLLEDNRTLRELLGSLVPLAPQLVADVAAARASEVSSIDVMAVTESNAALRALLAQLVVALPRGPAGDRARAEIGSYLLRRTMADPG